MFRGLNVIVVPDLITVKRSWKERLFTLPWKPRKKTKIVNNPAAMGDKIIEINGQLLCSPKTKALLLRELKEHPGNTFDVRRS